MVYINPKWIIVEFLRNRLTDPRGTRRSVSNSNSFTATAGQTEFSLSCSSGKSLSHISSVSVNSTAKDKWRDYYIDFRDEKIVFFSGLTSGDTVEVDFYENSTNWIFWDKPDTSLGETSFPRIAVLIAGGTGNRLGHYTAPVESVILPQIDVWAKDKYSNQIFTIDGKAYAGENLAEYLAYEVMKAFEDYEDDLHPALYDYQPTQIPPRTLPFDETYQCHHKSVEFEIKGINLGRVS